MTGALLTAGLVSASAATTGWCTWRCLRGLRAMAGTGRSACGAPVGRSGDQAELPRLPAEVAELRASSTMTWPQAGVDAAG